MPRRPPPPPSSSFPWGPLLIIGGAIVLALHYTRPSPPPATTTDQFAPSPSVLGVNQPAYAAETLVYDDPSMGYPSLTATIPPSTVPLHSVLEQQDVTAGQQTVDIGPYPYNTLPGTYSN